MLENLVGLPSLPHFEATWTSGPRRCVLENLHATHKSDTRSLVWDQLLSRLSISLARFV